MAEIAEDIRTVSDRARSASRTLNRLNREHKDRTLASVASGLRESVSALLTANREDLERGRDSGLSRALLDRLALDEERIENLAQAVEEIIALDDPIGRMIQGRTLPNGLRLSQISVPLGVLGVVYEARPNVTVDIAALALKSGNAAVFAAARRPRAPTRCSCPSFARPCAAPPFRLRPCSPSTPTGARARPS